MGHDEEYSEAKCSFFSGGLILSYVPYINDKRLKMRKNKFKDFLINQKIQATIDREKRAQNLQEIHLNFINHIIAPINVKKAKIPNQSRSPIARKFCSDLLKNSTPTEKYFQSLISQTDIPFVAQYAIDRRKSFYIIDFYIPSLNVCVELDGEYHQTKEQSRKDRTRDKWLKSRGFIVKRLTNSAMLKIKSVKSLLKYLNKKEKD